MTSSMDQSAGAPLGSCWLLANVVVDGVPGFGVVGLEDDDDGGGGEEAGSPVAVIVVVGSVADGEPDV